MQRSIVTAALIATFLSVPIALAGDDPTATDSAALPGAQAPAADAEAPVTADNWDAQRSLWTDRLAAAEEQVEQAELRHHRAIDAYSHMRARRRARGSEKQAIMDELTRADEALQAAEAELGEVRASARRAGVPPGWFRAAAEDREAPPAGVAP